jgi:hypothetical protein
VEFGDVFEGEAPHTTVTFTNKGEADFAVREVRTTCGCTVATVKGPDGVDVPAKPHTNQPVVTLKPGESIEVGVEMTTTGQHGAVEKSLQVHNIDPTVPLVSVPVRARVTKAFSVTPDSVTLGTIGKRGLIERELTIQSQSIGDWKIEGIESAVEGRPLPGNLRFEVLDTEGQARRVKLLLDGPRAVGPITSKVRIKVTHERVKQIEFFVYGTVQSDVVFSSGQANFPETLSFDQMDPDTKVTRTLTVTNHDPGTPYMITALDIQSPKPEFFKTTLRTIEEGVKYEIDVTADAALAENFFRGNLVVRAQHPDVSVATKVVPFHGWVRKAAAGAPPASPPATPASGSASPR